MIIGRMNRETFIGFIIAAAGADIAIMLSKIPFWIGIILLGIGIIIILHSLKIFDLDYFRNIISRFHFPEKKQSKGISRRIINRLLLNGKLISLCYIIGIALIIADIFYNSYYSMNKEIGTYDWILLFLGFDFMIYPLIWEIYPREADFILVFFIILTIEIVPAIAFLESENAFNSAFGNLYVQVAVVGPVVGLMMLSGIDVSSSGSIINFTMQNGLQGSVGIAISCSGIYSAMIFIAAFMAFTLSFYEHWERRLGIFLIIGILAAYLANIFRIYLVMLSGYFNGMGNPADPAPFTLLWTHMYAGEIIFICWIALFWWLAFKYLAPEDIKHPESDKNEQL